MSEPRWMIYEFTSEARETLSGWTRSVKVGGVEYSIAVKRDKQVRIPFKPHGTWGWTHHGTVYRMGDKDVLVWSGKVEGSIGCKGMLERAGVLKKKEISE